MLYAGHIRQGRCEEVNSSFESREPHTQVFGTDIKDSGEQRHAKGFLEPENHNGLFI